MNVLFLLPAILAFCFWPHTSYAGRKQKAENRRQEQENVHGHSSRGSFRAQEAGCYKRRTEVDNDV